MEVMNTEVTTTTTNKTQTKHAATRGAALTLAALGLLGAARTADANAVWGNVRRSAPTAAQTAALWQKGDLFLNAGFQRAANAAHARRPLALTATAPAMTSVIAQLHGGSMNANRQAQMAALGATWTRDLSLVHAVAVQVPTQNLGALAALPFIAHLSQDVTLTGCDAFTTGSSGAAVAAAAPYYLTGQGITVAVVDSGIYPHMDLNGVASVTSRVLASVSFVPGDSSTGDAFGHGTHVAGILAGNGNSSSGSQYTQTFTGIAPGANLVNVRVLDGSGQASVSTVISGLQWVISNAKTYNIRVVNLSLGHPVGESYTTDPLCQAVEQAYKAGIVVVAAAGNNGRQNATQTVGAPNEGYGINYGSINSPGDDPYVITVGAMKQMGAARADDRIATYSSRGPSLGDNILKPDLVAPGNRVISLDARGSYLETANGGANQIPVSTYCKSNTTNSSVSYFRLSGTSMATPVVSGAAALLLQQNPSLTPDTVKARLMISADKWTDPSGNYDPCTYGAGYVDIPAALQCAAVATASAASPPLVQNADGTISVSNVLWGNNVIWGNVANLNVIWGNNILWGNNVLWGNNILWGNRVLWGSNVLWGNNVIWGNNSLSGTTLSLAGE